MVDRKALIEALKCSIKIPGEKCRDDCPYLVREEIKPDFPMPPDAVIDGIGYWDSCDTNRMTMDCIEALREDADVVKEYDKSEIHENCTVHILENTKTGEVSVGWWENACEKCGEVKGNEKNDDACIVAREVLEKLIPKKPYDDKMLEEGFEEYSCPNCKAPYSLTYDGKLNFCSNCGQSLDW